ncbi:MAG TPA: C40 family peptidase [Bacteroidia bacterium]|jgi:hypothetical protein|nr:C40 family peptidase [Bacteroidia bacterium]
MYGICNLSVIPVRKEPSDKSEMVTQLLFGDSFKILEEKDQWRKIRNYWDDYEGWIDRKQFAEVSKTEYERSLSGLPAVNAELFSVILNEKSGESFPVTLGCTLPSFHNNRFSIGENNYFFDGTVFTEKDKASRQNIVDTALLFLNSPYLWGGKTPMGIDCSGFTQVVFKANGIRLKRDAYQQAESGSSYSFVEESYPGDLAFFDNEEGKITHVGIIITDNRVIHASGRVRIDHFDHYGIFTPERGGYTHHLRVIRKIVE